MLSRSDPREIARRLSNGHILAIDRSAKAIEQARAGCADEISSGRLILRRVAAEDFVLEASEALFDFALAVRVGALDGRHPQAGRSARERIAAALVPGAKIFYRRRQSASRDFAGRFIMIQRVAKLLIPDMKRGA